MPKIPPASLPPVRPESKAGGLHARTRGAQRASEFGQTLAKATKTDKNIADNRSGLDLKQASTRHDESAEARRAAADEGKSEHASSDEASEIATDPQTEAGSHAPVESSNPVDSGALGAQSGDAQVSQAEAQDGAQKPTANAQQSAQQSDSTIGQITSPGIANPAAVTLPTEPQVTTITPTVEAPTAYRESAQRGQIETASAQQTLATVSTHAPADAESIQSIQAEQAVVDVPNAVEKSGFARTAITEAVTQSIKASVDARVDGVTKESVQPSQQALSSLPPVETVKPPRPSSAPITKVQQAIELKGSAPSTSSSPETFPAVARAAQIEAAVRLENAIASLHTTIDGEAATHAESSIAQPSMLVGSKVGESLTQSSSLAQQMQQWASPDDPEFTGQMTRGLAAMLNQRGGTMTMRLNPPELGEVRVQMTISRGVVSAEFQPSTVQAHALLDKNLAALRTSLEGQGLTVDRLHVHASAHGSQQMWRDESSGSWNQQGGNGHDRHGHDAANGESRGRHEHESQGQNRWHRQAQFTDLFRDFESQFAALDTRNSS